MTRRPTRRGRRPASARRCTWRRGAWRSSAEAASTAWSRPRSAWPSRRRRARCSSTRSWAGSRPRSGGKGSSGSRRKCCRGCAVPDRARSRPRRVHHLQLAELLDPPLAVLAAEPAPLDAAERDLGAHVHVLVDPGGAALEALCDLLAARDVVGPHRAAEAVVRAVRLRERVVEVAVGDYGEGRAELLLADQAHALADVGHDGRRVEVAGRG